jgi:hypothetical protein
MEFGLHKRSEKERKPKLKHEEQGRKRKETSSLELSPENVHQRKWKALKLIKIHMRKSETPKR